MSVIKACSDAKYLDKGSGASCQNLVLIALLFPPLNVHKLMVLFLHIMRKLMFYFSIFFS